MRAFWKALRFFMLDRGALEYGARGLSRRMSTASVSADDELPRRIFLELKSLATA